jgi:hypothetical protein
MRFLALSLIGLALLIAPARAQQGSALVVTSCGTIPTPFVAGSLRYLTVDVNGNICGGGGGGGGTVPWQPAPMAGGAQYGLAVSGVTTLTVPSGAKCASILSETANVRYTTSGTTPSASVGMGPIVPGTPLQFCGSATLAALKFFAVSGSPTLDVEYFQ